MSFDTLMNVTVDVQQCSVSNTRRGGVTRTWTNRYASMPARIQPMTGVEAQLYGSTRTPVTHHMFVSGNYTGITEQDRIVYGTRTFEIELVRNIDEMDHHTELVLRELKQAI